MLCKYKNNIFNYCLQKLSCRILKNLVESCRILQYHTEALIILQKLAESCRILQNLAESCRIFHSFANHLQVVIRFVIKCKFCLPCQIFSLSWGWKRSLFSLAQYKMTLTFNPLFLLQYALETRYQIPMAVLVNVPLLVKLPMPLICVHVLRVLH